MLQFLTTDLYAVIVIAFIGILLLAFLTAWLYQSRGVWTHVDRSPRTLAGGILERTGYSKYTAGTRIKMFVLSAGLLACAGAVGIVYFAQYVWENPLILSEYNANLQFIFLIFSMLVFFISFSFVALGRWSRQEGAFKW